MFNPLQPYSYILLLVPRVLYPLLSVSGGVRDIWEGEKEPEMHKRNTEVDKLRFTLDFQLIKATEDLLAEILATGYGGYVEVIAELKTNRAGEVLLDVSANKLGKNSNPPARRKNTQQTSAVFHLEQGKGAKRIPTS